MTEERIATLEKRLHLLEAMVDKLMAILVERARDTAVEYDILQHAVGQSAELYHIDRRQHRPDEEE